MSITRRHLWRAKYVNVLRLAKSLKIDCPTCECVECKMHVIEAVSRAL